MDMTVRVIIVWLDGLETRFDLHITQVAGLLSILKSLMEFDRIKYFNITG